MTPEPENFDGLRRLLQLKRYEQPPPGYFNDFSRQVIAQIRADANVKREHSMDRLSWEVPWLHRLIGAFQAKPALAVSFGAAVCALLVGGVIYSESTEFDPAAIPTIPGIEGLAKVSPQPIATPVVALGAAATPTTTNSSLNVNIQPGGSLFDQFSINPQPVGFQLPSDGN
jgi:hypothetical protein